MLTSTTVNPIRLARVAIPLCGPFRPRVAVARVLDQGRGRHAVAGRVGRQVDAPDVRHVSRRMDRVGKLGAVARGHVAVAVVGDGLVVDVRRGRRRLRRQHRQRIGRLAGGVEADAVAAPRLDVAEQRPAALVGAPRLDHAVAGVEQGDPRPRGQAGDVHLLDAAARVEGRSAGAAREHERERSSR